MAKITELRPRRSEASERQSELLRALEDAVNEALQETGITVIEVIGLLRFVEASLLAGGVE